MGCRRTQSTPSTTPATVISGWPLRMAWSASTACASRSSTRATLQASPAIASLFTAGVVELTKLAVDAHVQGHGLGRRLTETALAWARRRGAKKVILLSSTKLQAALRLCERLGFQYGPLQADRNVSITLRHFGEKFRLQEEARRQLPAEAAEG